MTDREFRMRIERVIEQHQRRLKQLHAARSGKIEMRTVRVKSYRVRAHTVGAHTRLIAPSIKRGK